MTIYGIKHIEGIGFFWAYGADHFAPGTAEDYRPDTGEVKDGGLWTDGFVGPYDTEEKAKHDAEEIDLSNPEEEA